jgi:isopentenyl phosphate kinase
MPSKKPLTILKIGGSVITDRKEERPRLRSRMLARIAREIAEGWRPEESRLIIVHGAGSFGHPIVRRTGIDRGVREDSQRMAMGETQRLQSQLSAEVVRHLLRVGLPAFPCQPSAGAVMQAGLLVSLETEALEGLVNIGLVPVLNGVPAFDRVQGCSILSGDQIAGFLYNRLTADRILHGTNVKGIYTTDPSQDREARFFPRVDLGNSEALPDGVAGSSVTDVTGGMRKKLEEMRSVRATGQIFDATRKDNVRRALLGEVVGTRIDYEGDRDP